MRRALSLSSFAFAAVHLVATASPAFGQPASPPQAAASSGGTDVVHLKNGGQIRGTIVDVIPGSHARIQLATGEVTTIPWDEVARVESARTTMPAPLPPPVVAPRSESTAPRKTIHITAPRPVTLERRAPDSKIWVEVCSAPCDHDVVATGTFRIAGSGLRASKTFEIAAMSDDNVYIEVDPASKGWFVGGIVLTSVGGLTTFIGLIMVLLGSAAKDLGDKSETLTTAGLTVTGIGLIGAISGIVALTSNVHSATTVSPVPIVNAETASTTRRPVWIDTTAPRVPSPVTLPVFSTTF